MAAAKYDVAIIGGGPGGYSAALYCARSGYSVCVIERLSPGGQMATTERIDNYPGFDEGIDGFELGEKMQRGAENAGAQTLFADVTAVQLSGEEKRIETSSGEIIARALVLATGAEPKKLGLPQEEALVGRGVAYCATCDGMRYRGKTVAVVGGGNSAVEDAIYLAKICEKVYLIHRRDSLRAAKVYLAPLESAGVEFIPDTRVTELLHGDKLHALRLRNVKTGEERELAAEALFVAVGREPQTQLFAGQLPLTEGGYIPADETTCTPIPGVFAVGDVREKPLRQVVTAASDGAVAAHFIEKYLH